MEAIYLNTMTLNKFYSINFDGILLVIYSLTRGVQNLLWQNPYERAETGSQAKFSRETIAKAHRWPNGFHIIVRRLTQGVLMMLRPCSGSAKVEAAVAHVHRLKWNQRKGKLILSLWVS